MTAALSTIVAPTLVYFPFRGRGELIRMILSLTGTAYRPEVVQMADWPCLKPTTPFGQVPVWREYNPDGSVALEVGQSQAIARYLAAKNGTLLGTNEQERLRIEGFTDAWTEVRDALVNYFLTEPSPVKDAYHSVLVGKVHAVRTFHGAHLQQQKSKFYVGTRASLADLACFDVMDQLRRADAQLFAEAGPEVAQVYENVKKNVVAQYLATPEYLDQAPI